MATEPSRPDLGARPLARYRFEYERRRSLNIVLLCAGFVAVLLGTVVGINAISPPKEDPNLLAFATPTDPTPPRAMQAYKPIPLGPPPAPPPPVVITASAGPVPALPPVAPRKAAAPISAPPQVAVAAAPLQAPPAPVARTPEPAAPPPPVQPEIRLAEAAPAPTPRAPTNPCAGAPTALDQMLCADPDLRAADQRLAAAYRRARQLTDNPDRLQRDQSRWLARRNELAQSRTALLAHYDRRYRELWPLQTARPAQTFPAKPAGGIAW